MGHGISLDTGSCPRQGGVAATYALENHFHSTYWAADFFNLLTSPYVIAGAVQVVPSANNIVYSVPAASGSTFAWIVPAGASIVSGQGTNSITVNFGTMGGIVEVTETTSGNCKKDAAELNVTVTGSTNIDILTIEHITCFYNRGDNTISIYNKDLTELNSLAIYNAIGQKINQAYTIGDDKIVFSSELKTGIYFIYGFISKKPFVSKIMVY